jgi:ABC-2 type transport system ATP-binding protein
MIAQLDQVTKKYGPVVALRDVTLELRGGEILTVLGPNGAGKTTAIRLLLGLALPTSGSVTVFGQSPRDASARVRTGAMLQVGKVPETLRVAEHIDLFRHYYPSPLPVAEVIAAAGLDGLERRFYGELSGGQKQRVLFALALCGNPDLLFLDEPTVGLDVEARRGMWRQVRDIADGGRTVLLTTHYLDEADALADRVIVIHRGSILAEGTPAEIKSRVSGRRIRCATSLPREVVASLPHVREVRPHGTGLEILAAVAEPVVRELLARDPDLSGLEVTSAGLEDAFLALTAGDAAVEAS